MHENINFDGGKFCHLLDNYKKTGSQLHCPALRLKGVNGGKPEIKLMSGLHSMRIF